MILEKMWHFLKLLHYSYFDLQKPKAAKCGLYAVQQTDGRIFTTKPLNLIGLRDDLRGIYLLLQAGSIVISTTLHFIENLYAPPYCRIL
jgi:hypothetical protein